MQGCFEALLHNPTLKPSAHPSCCGFCLVLLCPALSCPALSRQLVPLYLGSPRLLNWLMIRAFSFCSVSWFASVRDFSRSPNMVFSLKKVFSTRLRRWQSTSAFQPSRPYSITCRTTWLRSSQPGVSYQLKCRLVLRCSVAFLGGGAMNSMPRFLVMSR